MNRLAHVTDNTFRVVLADDLPVPGTGIQIHIPRRIVYVWRGITVAAIIESFELIRESVPDFDLAFPAGVAAEGGGR